METSVSAIVPTYNRVHTIERAILSIINQSHPVQEIIVIDDGSIDSTRERITAINHPSILYHYQENRGVSHARNTGISIASSQWLAFLDSDDEWLPHKIERQLGVLASHPNYRLCHSNEIWIRNGKRVNQMLKHQKFGGDIFEKCLPLCVISPSSVIIHRDAVADIGPFDESLPACEDYDYWLRYCARHPVLYLEDCLIKKYGGHTDQLSRKFWGMDRFRIKALQKILAENVLDGSQLQTVIDVIEEKCTILETGARKHGNADVLQFCQSIRRDITRTDTVVSQPWK